MIVGSAMVVLLALLAVLYISLTHGSVTTADGSTTTDRTGTVTTLGADQVAYADLPAFTALVVGAPNGDLTAVTPE